MSNRGPRVDWDRIRSNDVEYIRALVSIDRDDPAEDMMQQAELYASVGIMWARAKSDLSKAEDDLEKKESSAFQYYREKEDLAIGHAEEKVATAKPVVEAKKKVRALQEDVDLKRRLLEALKHRRDMLVQIGADRRAEMDLV